MGFWQYCGYVAAETRGPLTFLAVMALAALVIRILLKFHG